MRNTSYRISLRHLLGVATSLGAISLASGCSAPPGDASASDSAITDQDSADIATLRVFTEGTVGGAGGEKFTASDCTPIGSKWDCTSALEARFGMPALHQILLNSDGQSFCHTMFVETVSKKAKVAGADGIGFYYSGYNNAQGRFIPSAKLNKIQDVTLKDGEPGVTHKFVGLASCDLGDDSLSSAARYDLKAYLRSTANGHRTRNWEHGSNHEFIGDVVHLERGNDFIR